jgi:hypothetical protein
LTRYKNVRVDHMGRRYRVAFDRVTERPMIVARLLPSGVDGLALKLDGRNAKPVIAAARAAWEAEEPA